MISDNDLLLYYYRDGLDASERARIASALSEQPELAARLHRLVAKLDASAAIPDVPVPAHVQRRWQVALERAAADGASPERKAPVGFFAPPRWRMAAAVCAVALLIVSVKVMTPPAPEMLTNAAEDPTTSSATDSLAYERGLRWHLASTERQIGNLSEITDAERRQMIEAIIEQNRLYAIAAERANEPQLARVLRAFTPLLEQVAAEGSDRSAGEVAQLNFELKVMQARLNAATTEQPGAESIAL
ncbi:hypothetical protein HNQ60_002783 [Povalibacter uvarum]|uniref:Uncharacterized protein n=1 Tax=Povalibacter uvarum TaxID=732238 RepID=A0A841HPB1_9GAMM|nr:hypothetical protein [Povalibacter uvarum]MBB6093902.1 hypothetical protein [Povalibacter uvarum]